MKRILATLALLLAAASAPAIDCEWTADIDRPHVEPFTLADGETAELACRLVRRGRDFDPFATSATIYYQTSGVDRASWAGAWSAPATVTGALLRATLPPSIVPTAPVVHAMIGASGPSGLVYRAAADLRYLPSPGATPNALPLPVQTIDFATVSVTNAPWALPSDVASAIAEATADVVTNVNGKTGAVVLTGKDVDIGYPGQVFGATNDNISVGWAALLLQQKKADASQVWTKQESYSTSQVNTMLHTVNTTIAGVAGEVAIVANDNIAQSNAITALQSAVAGVTVPDYSATNDVLVATIQQVAPAPGDYATVSNRAMNAVQAESDPTVPGWAKEPLKPTYTANEVGALSENPLAGVLFDFATNAGLYLAVSNIVSALGGSVTNFPTIP